MNGAKAPTLDQLIEEYKSLPQFCENVNYSDEAAIKKNNQSVKRMIKIVKAIVKNYGGSGIHKLKPLLDIDAHKTNLWIATHLLEEVEVDEALEEKALDVIKRVSATDPLLKVSYDHWLKLYFGTAEN
ncbi:hypothetical protein [Pseudochryseolinea flava]|uniref:DUF2019 domain-containing protein n=1 Tax=Pseudochryseolinea flava TaxID=2059302 RepID=A0A364XV74_9BACT|nr:hypothetical protein [Pseudochryseolinea flava]RAV98240.1 hypothetical protein DQQ10_24880 [Pseudochryseolinea flava]